MRGWKPKKDMAVTMTASDIENAIKTLVPYTAGTSKLRIWKGLHGLKYTLPGMPAQVCDVIIDPQVIAGAREGVVASPGRYKGRHGDWRGQVRIYVSTFQRPPAGDVDFILAAGSGSMPTISVELESGQAWSVSYWRGVVLRDGWGGRIVNTAAA